MAEFPAVGERNKSGAKEAVCRTPDSQKRKAYFVHTRAAMHRLRTTHTPTFWYSTGWPAGLGKSSDGSCSQRVWCNKTNVTFRLFQHCLPVMTLRLRDLYRWGGGERKGYRCLCCLCFQAGVLKVGEVKQCSPTAPSCPRRRNFKEHVTYSISGSSEAHAVSGEEK